MNYIKLLEDGYKEVSSRTGCPPKSRLEYLGDYIFEFTTYDEEMASLFACKAVEVCHAITEGKTFEYIENDDNHRWFLIMCNIGFFRDRIDWGTSIRGAFWNFDIKFQSSGLYNGAVQLHEEIKFTREKWETFMRAIVTFASVDSK